MDTFIQTLKTLKTQGSRLDSVLVKRVIEGFIDGVLILTYQGELIHINDNADQIINTLVQHQEQLQLMLQELGRVHRAVVDSCELYPESSIIIESEMSNNRLGVLRIRARRLQLDMYEEPLILIILEDQQRSIQSLVKTEVKIYGLTPREAEIWSLRRANYSYKEIAIELFISVNTVKKHLKNIHNKLRFHQFRQVSMAG